MGRIYRAIEVACGERCRATVAFVDTGADETVISGELADLLEVPRYGRFRVRCASDTYITGNYADVTLRLPWEGLEAFQPVGVSDIPFHTDDVDEEGVHVIIGLDFIQQTGMKLSP